MTGSISGNEIEQAKSEIIQALNDKADLTARQQHYETMLEQVNLRRSEVSQKLLRFKSMNLYKMKRSFRKRLL